MGVAARRGSKSTRGGATPSEPKLALVPTTPAPSPTPGGSPSKKEDGHVHGLVDQLHELINAVKTERAFLEAVLQQMPAGVIIADAPSGRLRMGNEQVEQIYRGPFRASRSIEEYDQWVGFHADGSRYQPGEWPIARAIRRGEIVLGEEIRVQRFDGTEAIISVNAGPIRNSRGEIVAGVVAFTDITESRHSLEIMREQEHKLRFLQRAADVAYWELDLTSGKCYWPPETFALMGRDPARFQPTLESFLACIHPKDRQFVSNALNQALANKAEINLDFRIVRANGDARWITARGKVAENAEKPVRFIGIAIDITERWAKERARIRKLLAKPKAAAKAQSAGRRHP